MKFSSATAVAATMAVLTVSAASGAPEDKKIVSFSDDLNTNFKEVDDPVMGGQSHGSFTNEGDCGLFAGQVKNVTFLNAPGFCNIQMFPGVLHNLDLSEYVTADLAGGIRLKVAYAQQPGDKPFAKYRFGLSAANIPKHGGQAHELEGQYKGNFVVKPTNTFVKQPSSMLRGQASASAPQPAAMGGACQIITIPFSAFSSDWSDFTGDCGGTDPDGTEHKCCSLADAPEVCPSADHLKEVDVVTVWAEGVEGLFGLRIYEINVTANANADGAGEIQDC